ncbi:YphA family membrane protein [Halobacillus andaensis]|uniref:YphA family membrane protein n=1 Tax=Halobacillus andaensis TaxID=1176239 RepID=UPI003D706625
MAVYYWYAWIVVILVSFFLSSKKNKKLALLIYVLIQMILTTYLQIDSLFWLSFSIQALFGIYLWAEPRPMLQHIWPVLFTCFWAIFQLFLLSNPVWYLFPGVQVAIIGVLILVNYLNFSLNSQLGLWLLMNVLGGFAAKLVSWALFLDYMPDYIYEQKVMLKGIIVILIINGIAHLRKSSLKLKRKKRLFA